MKKVVVALFGACLCGVVLYGDNALRVGDRQGLEFSAMQNAYDEYSAIFKAFDKGSSLLQSYEKLAKIHANADTKGFKATNDADGCSCGALKPQIELYKDFNHQGNKYIWQGKKLTIERECWGGGEYYFELEEVKGGVQITTKFSRD